MRVPSQVPLPALGGLGSVPICKPRVPPTPSPDPSLLAASVWPPDRFRSPEMLGQQTVEEETDAQATVTPHLRTPRKKDREGREFKELL